MDEDLTLKNGAGNDYTRFRTNLHAQHRTYITFLHVKEKQIVGLRAALENLELNLQLCAIFAVDESPKMYSNYWIALTMMIWELMTSF